MRYFKYEYNTEIAILTWTKSQFDLVDIILYLTDRNIIWGHKMYKLFWAEQVRFLLNYFICDFKKIKNDLGVPSVYVERDGDVYSKEFNPKRNKWLPSHKNLDICAMVVYDGILQDLEAICNNF